MEIRLLNVADVEKYRSIRLEALLHHPESFASSYKEEKNQPIEFFEKKFQMKNTFTLGAFEDSELVGIITFIKEEKYKLRHRANIVSMYVSPTNRGLGIGRALMEKVIQEAKDTKGVEQLYLTLVSNNISAKKLYSTLGFEIFGTEKRALKLENNMYLDEDHMVLFL